MFGALSSDSLVALLWGGGGGGRKVDRHRGGEASGGVTRGPLS